MHVSTQRELKYSGIGIKLASPEIIAMISGGVKPTLRITDHQELTWKFVSTNGSVADHTIIDVHNAA